MQSLRGQLLIAGPGIADPDFRRTVVLVVAHSGDGALGLVLNRPSQTTIGELVPQLDELIDSGDDVLVGGPVQPDAVIVLADFDDTEDAAVIAFASVGVMGAQAEPSGLAGRVRRARAFAGHAGWGPGQLDSELARGDWFTADARATDPFSGDPAALWATVLERKGGSYALVARMPEDPSLN